MNKRLFWSCAMLFFCAVLYLIWPTIHTIALRKVLILITAIIGAILWFRSADRLTILKSPWLIFLGLLFAWVVLHAGFISQNGSGAWQELLGQWIPAYFAILSGIGIALAGRHIKTSTFKIYLLVILAAQPVVFLLVTAYQSIHLGYLDVGFKVGFLETDLKTSLTFSSDMLVALACARILQALKSGEQFSKILIWLLAIILGIYVAVYTSSLNSILLISGCIFVMLVYALKIKMSLGRSMVAILIIAISVYGATLYPSVENKFQRMISNTKVAVSIDKYNNWINYEKFGLPDNEMGEKLGESFYLRVAYATASLRSALEHPFGYGVTRHAFERIIQQQYPDANIANAHNSYLNLSCAVGIPGLLLFVLVLVSVFRQLSKSDSEIAQPAKWMIAMYAAHWAIDSLERDHFFESYLFVIALLLTMTLSKAPQQKYA